MFLEIINASTKYQSNKIGKELWEENNSSPPEAITIDQEWNRTSTDYRENYTYTRSFTTRVPGRWQLPWQFCRIRVVKTHSRQLCSQFMALNCPKIHTRRP